MRSVGLRYLRPTLTGHKNFMKQFLEFSLVPLDVQVIKMRMFPLEDQMGDWRRPGI